MRKNILIGLGGMFGATSRYLVKGLNLGLSDGFPLNTFMVNIAGSFLLAFLLSSISEAFKIDEDLRLGITTGFLGAFTTFSTLCKETFILLNGGKYLIAAAYVLLSVTVGLLAAYSGCRIADKFGRLLIGSRSLKKSDDTDCSKEELG